MLLLTRTRKGDHIRPVLGFSTLAPCKRGLLPIASRPGQAVLGHASVDAPSGVKESSKGAASTSHPEGGGFEVVGVKVHLLQGILA